MERALIVRQPWVGLILSGQKTWEMRSSPTKVRGEIGLIEQGTGMIVGSVFLQNSVLPSDVELANNYQKHRVLDDKLFLKWPYAWILSDAKRFDEPAPYEHPMGAVIWVKLT